jgi:hypothetical protein
MDPDVKDFTTGGEHSGDPRRTGAQELYLFDPGVTYKRIYVSPLRVFLTDNRL